MDVRVRPLEEEDAGWRVGVDGRRCCVDEGGAEMGWCRWGMRSRGKSKYEPSGRGDGVEQDEHEVRREERSRPFWALTLDSTLIARRT